jgi:integrase
MANKKNHRRFGFIRKLPSGRYQASYLGLDGQRRTAPETFERKRDADRWLSVLEGDIVRGDWTDPVLGEVELGEYGRRWIAEHRCARRTREEYASLWRLHVEPSLGDVELAALNTERVRTWRSALLASGRSEDRIAKAYRLLHAVMATAADDGRVKRNPCRIKGAGQYRTPERPFASVPQVFALRAALPGRYGALVLSAAFTGLRWGELIALRRCDVDLTAKVLRVHRSLAQTQAGEMVVGPPKTEAGVRGVALPDVLVEELTEHVETYADRGLTGLLFTGRRGGALRRGNFHRETAWTKTVVAVGLPAGFHFHDLRHTGNQLAAMSGASTRELMRRMGHASMRAALVYQHASDERDRAIADRLGAQVEQERPADEDQEDDDTAAS